MGESGRVGEKEREGEGEGEKGRGPRQMAAIIRADLAKVVVRGTGRLLNGRWEGVVADVGTLLIPGAIDHLTRSTSRLDLSLWTLRYSSSGLIDQAWFGESVKGWAMSGLSLWGKWLFRFSFERYCVAMTIMSYINLRPAWTRMSVDEAEGRGSWM